MHAKEEATEEVLPIDCFVPVLPGSGSGTGTGTGKKRCNGHKKATSHTQFSRACETGAPHAPLLSNLADILQSNSIFLKLQVQEKHPIQLVHHMGNPN